VVGSNLGKNQTQRDFKTLPSIPQNMQRFWSKRRLHSSAVSFPSLPSLLERSGLEDNLEDEDLGLAEEVKAEELALVEDVEAEGLAEGNLLDKVGLSDLGVSFSEQTFS